MSRYSHIYGILQQKTMVGYSQKSQMCDDTHVKALHFHEDNIKDVRISTEQRFACLLSATSTHNQPRDDNEENENHIL